MPSSPSNFSDQITPGGTFITGTEVHTDYWNYKDCQKTAETAQVYYKSEAVSRATTGPGTTPTSKQHPDRGILKNRAYYKQDHQDLAQMAYSAGHATESHALDRDSFNLKYEELWKKKGNDSLRRHQEEATIQHNTAKNLNKRGDCHTKYGS
ncbi:unnamed protein product [Clonostachys byssicola]|uniref:Uncharacterized protein n=1 Tax=Clonostachys byssicola TaxID=160290 RepID=A0A9N9UDW5_9HYPO|nr:unnamed protein product [Clonostachys byssicola]